MRKKLINKLVICAPNINEGGPLTVLKEAIDSSIKSFPNSKIYVIVNNKKIVDVKNKKITILEYPESKKSWLKRIYHELIVFKKLSLDLKIDLWISLQDITSITHAKYQAVYCHCPIPFYKLKIKDIYFEPSSIVRNLFYNIIYRLNIHKNDLVIVQQEWLRKKFKIMTGHKKIIVARPIASDVIKIARKAQKNKSKVLIYPTLPRFHKNIELICKAISLINDENLPQFVVKITISGNENRYASYLKSKYSHIKKINFIGLQSKKRMDKLYREADALVFPSKLETWGLPISEAINFNLPILVSKLEYSRETLGDYNNVSFFDHKNPMQLKTQITSLIRGTWKPHKYKKVKPKGLFASNWKELWKIINHEFERKLIK